MEKRSSKLLPPIHSKLNDYEQEYLRRVATCWMTTRRRSNKSVSQLARLGLPTSSLGLFGVTAENGSLTLPPWDLKKRA